MSDIEFEIKQRIKQNGFVIPNEYGLYNIDPFELYSVISSMLIRGIIRRRDCDGIAYEFCD